MIDNYTILKRVKRKIEDPIHFHFGENYIEYNNNLRIYDDSVLVNDVLILYSELLHVFLDKVELLKLQKAEFNNEVFNFFITVVSRNGKYGFHVLNSTDVVILQEIFRMKKIPLRTRNTQSDLY